MPAIMIRLDVCFSRVGHLPTPYTAGGGSCGWNREGHSELVAEAGRPAVCLGALIRAFSKTRWPISDGEGRHNASDV